jgi:hypothetical protein
MRIQPSWRAARSNLVQHWRDIGWNLNMTAMRGSAGCGVVGKKKDGRGARLF